MKYCTKGGKCCLTDKTLSSGEKYCGISWILEIYPDQWMVLYKLITTRGQSIFVLFCFFCCFFWKGGIFLVFGGWEEGKLKVFMYIVSRDHVNNSIQANNRNYKHLMTPKNNMRQLNINLFFFIWAITKGCKLNSLTSMSDQDRISPYNINTISTR